MNGKDYLGELLRSDNCVLDDHYTKKRALLNIFQYMANKANSSYHADPLDILSEFRVLLDLDGKGLPIPKPRLYTLSFKRDDDSDVEAIVLAHNETEARIIASETGHDEFLDKAKCEEVNTAKSCLVSI